MMSPLVVGAALLTPNAVFWEKHGWRGEVTVSDGSATGDIILCAFVATRDEANRMAARALLTAAEGFVDAV
jgi:hypothetical protein